MFDGITEVEIFVRYTAMSDILNHGDLGIIALKSSEALGNLVNSRIKALRNISDPSFTYLVPHEEVRFNNGEGKIKLLDTVRGKDIYVIADVGNYSCTYDMFGFTNHYGPDEHFQDIKRVISAIAGKANRVSVIMPLLYASRQHRRKGRESMDCAMALQELENLGVNTILSFDVHDPNIQNAIPLTSFENILPTYSMLKLFIENEGSNIIKDNMTVISPDTGAMDRAINYANILGVDVGMFYKRRDHSVIIDGKNPIIQHEYIGSPLDGKKIMIVDDMIASGESVIDIIKQTKKYNPDKTYVAATFSFFSKGVAKFDELYEQGLLTKLYTTNLSYIPDEIRNRPWFCEVDCSRFLAKIISTLNHDESISPLLDSTHRFRKLLKNSQ